MSANYGADDDRRVAPNDDDRRAAHERRKAQDERLRAIELATAKLQYETRGQSKILGKILIEVKGHRQDGKAHELDDLRRFSNVEKDVAWMKKIGAFITTALGVSHWLK